MKGLKGLILAEITKKNLKVISARISERIVEIYDAQITAVLTEGIRGRSMGKLIEESIKHF